MCVQRDSGKEVADIHDVLGLYETKTYSFEELLQDPLPVGVDPTKLEAYLSDQEFETTWHCRSGRPRSSSRTLGCSRCSRNKAGFVLLSIYLSAALTPRRSLLMFMLLIASRSLFTSHLVNTYPLLSSLSRASG